MKLRCLSILLCLLFFPAKINAKKIVLKNYIIVVALESETSCSDLNKFAPVVYTGMGKVNAAIKLYDAILLYHPDLVINYGTAGAINNSNGLFHIDTFIQRDMDARALGVPRGVTPFSNQELPLAKGIVLGTGDSFVTNQKKQLEGLDIQLNLVDMEGFALMKVCKHHGIEFQCYKFVTDVSDSAASSKWKKSISSGIEVFKKMLCEKYGISKLTKLIVQR
ncbi:MAG: 5'-methylthioadenosine nucleosidase [Chlamydiae bacterium]|nr:MAG: 5'-methylthioadenosine nucleosidase [Chlamydiota bacterium]